MIARLTEDHARIRRLATELEAYLVADSAPVDPGFARCRWELLRELFAHLACVARTVEQLRRRPGAPVPTAGLDATLDEALRAYMLQWTGGTIQQAWRAYRSATRVLLRRSGRRIAYEESALLPLLR